MQRGDPREKLYVLRVLLYQDTSLATRNEVHRIRSLAHELKERDTTGTEMRCQQQELV